MRFRIVALLFASLGGAWAADVGQLGMVQGDVTVGSKPAANGQAVKVGDILDTKTGKCALMMPGKGIVHFGPGTRLKLEDRDGAPQIALARGQVRALVAGKDEGPKPKLRIRTPTATMGVRGTEVYVAQPDSRQQPAQFVTLEGVAQVDTPKGLVDLGANQSLATGGGSAPAPVAIAPETAAAMAYAVAPPAGEIMTMDQAAQTESSGEVVAESEYDADSDSEDVGEVAYDDMVEFDPLADGGVIWDVDVSITKQ